MHVKVPGVQVLQQVVDVVVTRHFLFVLFISLLLLQGNAMALVLEEERADVLFHSYDGGGITIDGPSVLVRKNFDDKLSVVANYYVDNISSASIDVTVSGASRYTEDRVQQSVGLSYLFDKSLMGITFTTSEENDYDADTTSLNMSQEMFGGLTTVSMAFTVGNNVVGKKGDPAFSEDLKTKGYRISLSQVLTKNMIMGLAYEIITDEGYLNNPYRFIRYYTSPTSYTLSGEIYPKTRTSNAAAVHLRHYLPFKASVYAGFRTFVDTWEINSTTFDVGYIQEYNDNWTFEFSYRVYSQDQAEFYKDIFNSANEFNFMARDKELSTFSDYSIGLGATYEFGKEGGLGMFEKGSVNLFYTYFDFQYDNFRDASKSTPATVGQEPLYTMTADVIRFFVSFWF